MTATIIDPSFYCQLEKDRLLGINGIPVDQLLRPGANGWKITQILPLNDSWQLKINKLVSHSLEYISPTQIARTSLEKTSKWTKIERTPSDPKSSRFAYMRMKITL